MLGAFLPPPATTAIAMAQAEGGRAEGAVGATATPQPTFLALVCGPDGFVEQVAGRKGLVPGSQGQFGGILQRLGYHEGQVFKLE